MRVARSLAFDHHTAEVSKDRYVQGATITSRWEHLANGFTNITDWIGFSHLSDLAPRFIMGALADAIVGGSTIDLAYCRSSRTLSFDKMFERVNSRAIAPTSLKKLLRREIFGDLVDETIAECQSVFEKHPVPSCSWDFCSGSRNIRSVLPVKTRQQMLMLALSKRCANLPLTSNGPSI